MTGCPVPVAAKGHGWWGWMTDDHVGRCHCHNFQASISCAVPHPPSCYGWGQWPGRGVVHLVTTLSCLVLVTPLPHPAVVIYYTIPRSSCACEDVCLDGVYSVLSCEGVKSPCASSTTVKVSSGRTPVPSLILLPPLVEDIGLDDVDSPNASDTSATVSGGFSLPSEILMRWPVTHF